jgi:catechol 2,3-dioxygenase-like lactoylglutathione lyase family enzyme
MQDLFGWHIRWEGSAMNGAGYTVHVGTDTRYVALYTHNKTTPSTEDTYQTIGALNHIAVTVSDIEAMEQKVIAAGFAPKNHGDYEPGRRFYFHDKDGVEYEVVSYETKAA